MSTISYVITGLKRGGAEKQLLIMAKEAAKLGYKVDVYVLSNENAMLDEFIFNGISVYFINLNIYNFIFKLFTFSKMVKLKKIKLIHAHMFHSIIFSRLLKIICPNLKVISSAHCNEEGMGLRGVLLRLTDFLSFFNSHVSKTSLSLFIKTKAFSPKKSNVINNAVDIGLKSNLPKKNIITSIGRLEPSKGFDTLIRSFYLFSKVDNEIKLYIIGDGSEYNKLISLINKLDLKERVFLIGSNPNIIDFLDISRLFISTSKAESFGMAICEAIGSNTISLIPDLLSVSEIVGDDYPKYLKHNNEVEDVYMKIKYILSHEDDIYFDSYSSFIKDKYNSKLIFKQWDLIYKDE
ncbi:TPA: glycosyltransferase [Photobacterium damselae]